MPRGVLNSALLPLLLSTFPPIPSCPARVTTLHPAGEGEEEGKRVGEGEREAPPREGVGEGVAVAVREPGHKMVFMLPLAESEKKMTPERGSTLTERGDLRGLPTAGTPPKATLP